MKPNSFFSRKKSRVFFLLVSGLVLIGLFTNCSQSAKLSGSVSAGSENSGATDGTPLPSEPGPNVPRPPLEIVQPNVSLDFLQNSSKGIVENAVINNFLIMNRNSIGTYFSSSGLLLTVQAHLPRFDHDPNVCRDANDNVENNCTRQPLGLLVEESRTNRVPHSVNLLAASWSRGANTTVTANAGTAPDGTQTAHRVLMQDVDGTFLQAVNTVEVGKTYVISLFARSDLPGQICFGIQSNTPQECALFSLTTRWKRFSTKMTATSTTNLTIENTTTSGMTIDALVWGVQVEEASSLSSYIPTNGTPVTRLQDWPTLNNNLGWFNPNEGSLYAEWKTLAVNPTREQAVFGMTNSTGENSFRLSRRSNESGSTAQFYVPGGNINNLITPMNSNPWDTQVHHSLLCYSTNQIASTDQVGSTQDMKTRAITALPTGLSLVTLGHSGPAMALNGHLKKFRYYKKSILMDQIEF